jgi:hypothetical protein
MLLREQAARMIAAGAGEVGMDVHPSGHDDHTPSVEGGRTVRHIRNNAAILDADVSYFAIHTVCRVV